MRTIAFVRSFISHFICQVICCSWTFGFKHLFHYIASIRLTSCLPFSVRCNLHARWLSGSLSLITQLSPFRWGNRWFPHSQLTFRETLDVLMLAAALKSSCLHPSWLAIHKKITINWAGISLSWAAIRRTSKISKHLNSVELVVSVIWWMHDSIKILRREMNSS